MSESALEIISQDRDDWKMRAVVAETRIKRLENARAVHTNEMEHLVNELAHGRWEYRVLFDRVEATLVALEETKRARQSLEAELETLDIKALRAQAQSEAAEARASEVESILRTLEWSGFGQDPVTLAISPACPCCGAYERSDYSTGTHVDGCELGSITQRQGAKT